MFTLNNVIKRIRPKHFRLENKVGDKYLTNAFKVIFIGIPATIGWYFIYQSATFYYKLYILKQDAERTTKTVGRLYNSKDEYINWILNMIPSQQGENVETQQSDQKRDIPNVAKLEPQNSNSKLEPAPLPGGDHLQSNETNQSTESKENETILKIKELLDEKKIRSNLLESEKQQISSALSAILSDKELIQSASLAKNTVLQESENIWERISQLHNSIQLPNNQANIQNDENK